MILNKFSVYIVLLLLFAMLNCTVHQYQPNGEESSVDDTQNNESLYVSEEDEARDGTRSKVYNDNIRTVRIYRKGWELGFPVIQLSSNEQLELHFDELDGDFTNYRYRLIHCTKNWERSSMNEMDYIEGFNDNYVSYHEPSFNSFQNYIHYAVLFPNEDVKLLRSGNYIVEVYPEGDEYHPIFVKRFFVTENITGVSADIKYPANVSERYYAQEVDFTINVDQGAILNPYNNLKVEVVQNQNELTKKSDFIPSFVKENSIIYNYEEENVFQAGNEYRHLDLTTTQTRTAQVAKFDLAKDTMHAYVLMDINRQFKKYLQYDDINGRYITKTLDGTDWLLESNYVMTHFTLPYETPLASGNFYLYGELSDFNVKEDLKMHYNYDLKAYQVNAYLKQGYYNYKYLFVPDDTSKASFDEAEGNHFDTENEYTFRVYYSDPTLFFDRLIIFQTINSREDF